MGNLVKYGGFDLQEAEAQEKELAKGSSSYFEAQQGLNVVRFIPALVGRPTFVVTHNHYIEIPGTEDKISFNCPRLMTAKGQPRGKCLACEAGERLASSGNPLDRKRGEKFYARKRVYGNVLSRAQPEEGVQTYAFGKKIHERLIQFRKDEGLEFTDPVNGYDVKIVRKGTMMATKYPAIDLARQPSRLAPTAAEINALIEAAPDLSKHAAVPSRDEQEEQLDKAGAMAAEDLSDEPPRGKRPAARTVADDATDAEFTDPKEGEYSDL